ncbi:MAG: hypothetical protein K5872_04975 [Rhizobiaceae bacterium]|nr:hypothetical protein [Rhizobiaceae bacterium]MCV0405562.1 hypothetical protein [Rhizobiaceae bacterium]
MKARGLRFARSRTGNIATMLALFSPVAIGLAAVAVDIGAVHLDRRNAQSLTDIAALVAVSDLPNASGAATASFADNKVKATLIPSETEALVGPTVRVTRGRIDPTKPPRQRFVADAEPANAVRVDFRRQGRLHFAGTFMDDPTIAVSAVASRSAEGAFSVGSRLASLKGGIANKVLGALLGTELSLSVMDYEALVKADVSLFSFLDRLAIETGVTAGTYDRLLATRGTVAQLASALSKMDGLPGSVRAILSSIAASPGAGNIAAPLDLLVQLGSAGSATVGTAGGGLDVTAGVLEILTAAAAVGNGERQLALDLGAALPGLLDVRLDLAVGEPPVRSPWLEMGEPGSEVRTAQTRLIVNVGIAGPGGAIGSPIHLPIYVELASARARLTEVSCPSGHPDSAEMKIAARPGVAELRIAAVNPTGLDDFTRDPSFSKATLVNTALVKVRADARLAIENMTDRSVTFSAGDIKSRSIKTVSTTTPVASLTRSLIDDLDLDIQVLGLDLGVSSLVQATLKPTLRPLAPVVDEVLMTILDAVGVGIGEADIRAHGVRCGPAVLVQ